MGRVCDYHISLGKLLHHASPGGFHHPLTLFALNLRITFLVLVFVLDFLLGHLHVVLEFDLLISKVCSGNQHIKESYSDAQIENQRSHLGDALIQRHIVKLVERRHVLFQVIIHHITDQRQF